MKPIYCNNNLYVNIYAANNAIRQCSDEFSWIGDEPHQLVFFKRGVLYVNLQKNFFAGETALLRVVINRICLRMIAGKTFEAAKNEVLAQFNSIIVPL